MRISLTAACLVLLFLSILTQSAYTQVRCSCENAGDTVCPKGEITCPDGCTAICAANNACYLSCRTNMFEQRLTLKFQKKTGEQMASVLSNETGMTIQFDLYPDPKTGKPRTRKPLYDFKLTNSDIWPALVFLDKRGTVKINGVEFRTFQNIQSDMKSGRKFSVRFKGDPARKVVSALSFLSQMNLVIKSGDPASPVFVELNQMSLNDILKEISKTAKVEIEVSEKKPQKK